MSSIYDDVNRINSKSDDTRLDDVERKISVLDDEISHLIADINNVSEEWKERDTMSETIVYVDASFQDFLERLEKIAERLY
jgi:tetrahydromethanopterin S-methyltransferase subunit G